ncbi:FAD-dependent monooxygenase [Fictibacillus fluitans]|uniref:FAD-dependent monooxygenase n=1 Tax=Fictibacillus fluitans TaxID=3058422 RepID=A0ABT8I0H3_9BACL|nr:FAD-dependent monooxygenase [Fictibacillus sp. NE201]MDN4526022.1 FAD-dependent monooxygenase [Fictibacillus sp. NE201]
MNSKVLIVGAGPTGLVLALQLARFNIPFRIIEKHSGPGEASRALVVHSRILEFYRQLGISDEVVNLGIPLDSVQLHEGLKEKAQLKFSDLKKDIGPYPFALCLAQDVHEKYLVKKLQEMGITIEWNTSLHSFSDEGESVKAVLTRDGVKEEAEFAYLCGCDGAHSTVRKGLGLGFSGGTYEELFYVADVESSDVKAQEQVLKVHLSNNGLCICMPVRTTGMVRLIGIVPPELREKESLNFQDVQPAAEEQIGIRVTGVNWFSTYHVHHRVSDHFRKGRCFIAGDAGHIHSPAGGQGMNTGISDAVNLAWKLAAVLEKKADPAILDTYETERIAFARTLISTTDRAFQVMVGKNFTNRMARTVLIPYAAPLLFGFSITRRIFFSMVSQLGIEYRHSALSKGTAGKIHGGDRLPWCQTVQGNNFDALRSLDWQVHIYGEAKPNYVRFCENTGLPLHVFPWEASMDVSDLKRNAAYLIRPDGYVAIADDEQDPKALKKHLEEFSISPLF